MASAQQGGLEEQRERETLALLFPNEELVSTPTLKAQRAVEAPSIVYVVTAEEIQARGYTSLAQVLRVVPGFYDVYDLVTHNVGIRGINGGQAASGSVLKLMIDGQAVDYRPTTGNFFGEELIPLEMVERIEIIRGPASAIYGANAFLGVVNVITKTGKALPGLHLIGRGALVRNHLGGGGGVIVGGSSGPIDVLVGADWLYLDRSGLRLPSSSLALMSDPTLAARAPSRNDTTRPASVFAKLSVSEVLHGRFTAFASLQNLDAHGEFQSFAHLTHDTRIVSLNQNYRAIYEVQPHERVSLRLGGHYFKAGPTGDENLDLGRTDYIPIRSVGADGGGVDAETRILAHRLFTLTLGTDFVQENYLLQTFSQKLLADVLLPSSEVLRKANTIIPGENFGAHTTFRNYGAYAQGVLALPAGLSAVAGARLDVHSVFGVHVSPRAALVWAPTQGSASVKLLYGASFKAPSAEQLYTQPITVFDVQGNPKLQSQTAHTLETAGEYRLPKEHGSIAVNVFATDVLSRVEFLPTGNYLQATNINSEWVMGSELDSRFVVVKPFHVHFLVGIARTIARSLGPLIPETPQALNELFPTYQLHLLADYMLPWWKARASLELSYIGSRPASLTTALGRRSEYDLPGYVYSAFVLSMPDHEIIPHHPTNAALRIDNLFNIHYTEPGFGGIDIPAQGITAILTIVQAL